MIKVELVGGAKKLFAAGTIEIERCDLTLNALFDILQDMRLDDAPPLEPKNTLVAINGIDSSAKGGMSYVARDGDVVSVIPVIHGGSGSVGRVQIDVGKRHFDVSCIAPPKPISPKFLDDLRSSNSNLRIQIICERFVLGKSHVEKILALSVESEKRGVMLANKIETDIMMRFALTAQISNAIKTVGMGISSRANFVVISMGSTKNCDRLYKQLEPYRAVLFGLDNSSYLGKKFKITKKITNATMSRSPLEDILVERAAILNTDVT